MSDTDYEKIKDAKLQDVKTDDLEEQLKDLAGRSSRFYDAEYGVNRDDGHLVFHFFPPGYAADARVNWENWHQFRDRLEAAIMDTFPLDTLDAGYSEELRSFHVVTPYPAVPDASALISKFFEKIETAA